MATLALNLELIATAHELVWKVSSVMFALWNVEFNAVYEIFFSLWAIMRFSGHWF